MKKLAAWVLALVFALSFALPQDTAFASTDTLKVVVDDVKVGGKAQAFILNDQLLLPIESLFEEAGFKVSKDDSGNINVTNTYLTIDFNVATKTVSVNGQQVEAKFHTTLKDSTSYISSDFLATLEGFDVNVFKTLDLVKVTTNRVNNVAGFLEQAAAADLKSVSTALTMDLKMESSFDEEAINLLMDIKMDQINDPVSFYTLAKTSTDFAGEAFEDISATYLTKDGYFQQIGDVWVKYDDELTESLLSFSNQSDLLAQLEELQMKFTKGLNIFDYDGIYVMTQTISNEEFSAMMEEVMDLLLGSGLTEETVVEEIYIEATPVTEEEAKTEDIVEMTVLEEAVEVTEAAKLTEAIEVTEPVEATEAVEATEIVEAAESVETTEAVEATESVEATEIVEAEVVTEEEIVIEEEAIMEGFDFEDFGFNIEDFYVVSTIDKKTFFPREVSAIAHITMTMGEDTLSFKLSLAGGFSNYNTIKEIKVPAEVINNAISMDEFMEILEAEFQAEFGDFELEAE